MRKLILASTAAIALFGVAACSDSADNTTTQSIDPPATSTPAPSDPSMTPAPAPKAPAEEIQPAPATPAPAQ
jgi:predicted outer membrane protein